MHLMLPNIRCSFPLSKCVFSALITAIAVGGVFSSSMLTMWQERAGAGVTLQSNNLKPRGGATGAASRALMLDGMFYETAAGRVALPQELTARAPATIGTGRWTGEIRMPDGRLVRLSVSPQGGAFTVALNATPAEGVIRWGLAVEALQDEYYTGLMERVVDGPQQASWAPGITTAMNLRGQRLDMLVK